MTHTDSPSSSPARKRQRLSSPTYDEQLADLSQADITAFDKIEALLSQNSDPRKLSQKSAKSQPLSAGEDMDQVMTTDHYTEPPDDPENPFNMRLAAGFNPASALANVGAQASVSGFTSAFQLASMVQPCQDSPLSPSPEAPPECDYSSWFEPETVPVPIVFQTAKVTALSSTPFVPASPTSFSAGNSTPFTTPSVSFASAGSSKFMRASNKGFITPSVTAFQKAEEKMKIWQDSDPDAADPAFRQCKLVSNPPTPTSPRLILRPVENSSLGTQNPSSERPVLSTPFIKGKLGFKPFKSPLINPTTPISKNFKAPSSTFTSAPLPPHRPETPAYPPMSSQHPHPLASTTTTYPTQVNSHGVPTFSTPVRPAGLGRTPRKGGSATVSKSKFVTPFKVGMGPGDAGRLTLDRAKGKQNAVPVDNWLTRGVGPANTLKVKEDWKVFNLSFQKNRKTLKDSGLVPQMYSSEELETIGINVSELSQMTPALAGYYSFHSRSSPNSSSPLSQPPITILGPQAALEELQEKGCTIATKEWVDNAWGLILWKLAGMVGLDPERESRGDEMRWCWDEVMRQLLYRYERELNQGSRPPLRLLTAQDTPASSPMVLCISNVTWSQIGLTDDGVPVNAHPELEVTDGWYRLRAKVDEPMARAIRRGILRIGRKIGIVGAKLTSERKEPAEILSAYTSTALILSGNSTHLAAWYTKLGFQPLPSIATLNSLSPDGGVVTLMEVVVEKVYPVAYIEFIQDADGQKRREGPRHAKEERIVEEKWKARRDVEASKLRDVFEKKMNRMEGWAERLERKAGGRFKPGDDDFPPDHTDELYDDLEDASDVGLILARLTPVESGWLARFIREKIEKDRERTGDEIEHELKSICPQREVRNFRVVVASDAQTDRRPAYRKAQITVWDVLSLSLGEDGERGNFQAGQKFRVTNLIPTRQQAWMDRNEGSEVYLATRRDSRWTRMY